MKEKPFITNYYYGGRNDLAIMELPKYQEIIDRVNDIFDYVDVLYKELDIK